MENRKTLASKGGISLVEVTEVDENGNIIKTSYEACGPDGIPMKSFSNLKDAQSYLKSLLPEPEPPKPSRGMSM